MTSGVSMHKPAHIPDALWHSVHAPRTPDSQTSIGTIFSGGGAGAVAAPPQAPHACALCGVAAHASPLHFGVGSFAYCTGCLLKVGAAYANGSSQAEAAFASFAAPQPRSQPTDATMRTCGTCLASKAISNFLRQDGGAVRLERDCNECAAGAARQQAQQQLQLGAWQAAAQQQQHQTQQQQQQDAPQGLRHNSGAVLLAQLSSVLHTHMAAQQHHQGHQQHDHQQQVPQWQPPPLLAGSLPGPLPAHLQPRSPLIPEPQRLRPQHSGALPVSMPLVPVPQHLKSGTLSLSKARSRADSTESDEDYAPSPRTSAGQRARPSSRLGPRPAGATKVTAQGKTHKTCSRCKQEKPASCYNLDRGKPDGLYCHCRACCAEMNAVRNQKKVLITTPTVDAKTCTHCRQHKPAADFYRQNTSHDGLRSWCKTCYSSASAAKSRSSQKRAKRESS